MHRVRRRYWRMATGDSPNDTHFSILPVKNFSSVQFPLPSRALNENAALDPIYGRGNEPVPFF